jgi:hypothetical protein
MVLLPLPLPLPEEIVKVVVVEAVVVELIP